MAVDGGLLLLLHRQQPMLLRWGAAAVGHRRSIKHANGCFYTPLVLPQIQLEIYHEGTPEGSGPGAHPAALGAAGRQAPGQRAFRLLLRLAFPGAKAADCCSRARELLRAGAAAAAGVEIAAVSIDRIAAPNAARGQPHLVVHLAVLVGPDLLKAAGLAKAVTGRITGSSGRSAGGASGGASGSAEQREAGEGASPGGKAAAEGAAEGAAAAADAQAAAPTPEQLAQLLGGEPLVAALGLPDPARCAAQIEDVTPACAVSEAERAQQAAVDRGETGMGAAQDRRLAHVSGCHRRPASGVAYALAAACRPGACLQLITACRACAQAGLQAVLAASAAPDCCAQPPTCLPALPAACPSQNRARAAL